ncbi:MAG: HEAT repeat domain-containing protein, partial [Methanoregula sp.]|nr:HEAT repeat domain-containing protein [Methanoregula sp.]
MIAPARVRCPAQTVDCKNEGIFLFPARSDMMKSTNPPAGQPPVTDEYMQGLIAALSDPSIDRRHAAVRALRECGAPAVAPLIAALASAPDADHRWYAAIALSKIGEPTLAPLLRAMAGNPDHAFRRYAAAALGEMGERAVEPLISAMATDDRV